MPPSKLIKSMNDALDSIVEPPQFPQFGKLPIELRLMCWRAAIPGPRIIRISLGYYKTGHHLPKQSTASSSIPNIFAVNQESREIAEAAFTRSYSQFLMGIPIIINISKDALVFDKQQSFIEFIYLSNHLAEFPSLRLPPFIPPPMIGLADTTINQGNLIFRGISKSMRVLGRPHRIFFLRKTGAVGYNQSNTARQINENWDRQNRKAGLPYKGPLAETCTFKQLQTKLDSPDNSNPTPKVKRIILPTRRSNRTPKVKGIILPTRRSGRLHGLKS